MPRGFISLGRAGCYINKDYIVDHFYVEDKGIAILTDKFGCRWTIDSKLLKGIFDDE